MFKTIALTLALTMSARAVACDVPVTPLNQGDKAPCTGYLFSPEEEQKLRIQNEDYKVLLEESKIYIQEKDTYKKELTDQQEINDKKQKEVDLWKQQADSAIQKYVEQQERQSIRDWVFLISGVLLTVAAGYAVGQANHK